MSDGEDRATDPGEVFAAVANETRFDILRALWHLTRASEGEAASFAEIRSEAGVRDSGQFNYHLQELMPRFVAEADDGGYVVTYAGARLVGAVVSGVYTDDGTSVEPRPVGECPNCGGTVEAGYETEQMRIECVDCEVTVTDMPAPPVVAAGHDPQDLPSVYSQYLYTETERMNRGFCPSCSGRIDTTIREPDGDGSGLEAYLDVVHECRECGARSHSALGATVIDHPAVVSLYHDAGIDVRETPIWELGELFDTPGEILGEDPLRVETTVEVDGEAVDLLLDGSSNVIESERRPVEAEDD
ncbi:helix-turn-helix transcriptional regulator [Halosimplex litoreum]|uniref:Helix-turn-helix transcriptional regulator n=1 Tax=Halosimplex litoreum TaxID=1198301 RepID=A0A7T3FZD6_9EURY|nr:helix-turn-helix domain-containing protein [Halosimplex litoreum]QPV63543.1 helix-turn-helix transcriptional regulator [Halosimplex litoreum]